MSHLVFLFKSFWPEWIMEEVRGQRMVKYIIDALTLVLHVLKITNFPSAISSVSPTMTPSVSSVTHSNVPRWNATTSWSFKCFRVRYGPMWTVSIMFKTVSDSAKVWMSVIQSDRSSLDTYSFLFLSFHYSEHETCQVNIPYHPVKHIFVMLVQVFVYFCSICHIANIKQWIWWKYVDIVIARLLMSISCFIFGL